MAGIKEAMKRVMDGRNEGVVVAEGYLKECDCDLVSRSTELQCSKCKETRYIIIRLKDEGLITQYDYGADIHIEKDASVRDKVMLIIDDNWNATWRVVGEV